MLAGENAVDAVRDVARTLASLHGGDQETACSPANGIMALSNDWRFHLGVLVGAQHTILDPVRLARISSLSQLYLAGRARLFELRVASGRMGAAHAGLAACELLHLSDDPRVVPSAQAGQELCPADPLAEVAGVALDLELCGRQALVGQFVEAYREFSGDIFPPSLVHHYVALEATARASRALRGHVGVADESDLVRKLVLLAVRHLDIGRPHLILIGGEPGAGKSTLAARLVDACGWTLLNSGQVRSDAVGGCLTPGQETASTSGRHDRAMTVASYSEMLRRARLLLERGQSVIIDATWSESSSRDQAAQMAAAVFADVACLRCDAGKTARDARIRNRIAAGPAIAEAAVRISRRIAAEFQPWPEATIVDTRQPIWCSVSTALRAIGAQAASMPIPLLENAR